MSVPAGLRLLRIALIARAVAAVVGLVLLQLGLAPHGQLDAFGAGLMIVLAAAGAVTTALVAAGAARLWRGDRGLRLAAALLIAAALAIAALGVVYYDAWRGGAAEPGWAPHATTGAALLGIAGLLVLVLALPHRFDREHAVSMLGTGLLLATIPVYSPEQLSLGANGHWLAMLFVLGHVLCTAAAAPFLGRAARALEEVAEARVNA